MAITLMVLASVSAGGSPAAGASLATSLHQFIRDKSQIFQSDVAETLTPLLERLAARGTALPATSTAPGIFYVFDYETGVPRREVGSFGSIFIETPQTVGRRNFTVGLAYLHADLTQFDGHDLAGQVDFGSRTPLSNGALLRTALPFDQFALHTDSLSVFGTYGITDRWDVNVLTPLLYTRLDVQARQVAHVKEPTGEVEPLGNTPVSFEGTAVGVGDVLVRTKYRLTDPGTPASAAVGLTLRTPTGSAGDFQGLGDWTLEPYLSAARGFGPHELHGVMGFELNTDDPQRSRVTYGIGGTIRLLSWLSMIVDLFGSSGVTDDTFDFSARGSVPVSDFLTRFETRPPMRRNGEVEVFAFVPRTDIVDVSIGWKVRLWERGSAYVSAVIPVVRDGLRAPVIPAAGIEYTM
jgi:hypothetical protein